MTEARDFWSRRKAAVQAEADAEVVAVEQQTIAARQTELEEKTDAEILEELNLPDPDQLQAGDDVSGFMAKAVPDRLRRRALRRLWRLNPVLANVDGLVDYGEDYTDAACVIENLQTAYQVGKGMLAHVEALTADAEDTADETPEADAPSEEPIVAETETPEPEIALAAAAEEPETTTEALAEVDAAPAPRRMKFEFEG
ncbi:DUF3306 domain-containing protein [Ruegeria sp. R14_0]|uniref:DUF3306 domain-containing protein n=1 Tax=Ruegeria sp. R14_0 TaxID=2821100 RepID=UPI001ADBAE24|nr:DUF3306 domain-containing protein [Ruegeria sp. R14_0]MBO9446125.1 DUF3306 domain-containing protein [Ruegeria sp. R14_0]